MEEISAIDQAQEEQRSTIGIGFWKPFQAAATNKRVMWRLFLGSMLFFWQNGSGINAINYYSVTVFKVRLRFVPDKPFLPSLACANIPCRVSVSLVLTPVFSLPESSAWSRQLSPLSGCYT